MAIYEAVREFTDPPAPRGKLAKLARRQTLPEPVHANPREELRRLVRLHTNISRSAVALHHMRSDRKSRATGAIIHCLLPDDLRADLERAQKRFETTDKRIAREMARALKQLPIWSWLGSVAGFAEKTSAILVGEADIARATKASSLKMFFGSCPVAETGRLVRPVAKKSNRYHSGIRTVLWQAFTSMMKNEAKRYPGAPHGRTNKYLDIWYAAFFGSMHDPRYDANAKTWSHVQPSGETSLVGGGTAYLRKRAMWKAVDIFVEDLYTVWRALEGLSVWPDWYAAKLGYMHGGKIAVREPRLITYDEAVAMAGDVGWRPLAEPRSWKTAGTDEEDESDEEADGDDEE